MAIDCGQMAITRCLRYVTFDFNPSPKNRPVADFLMHLERQHTLDYDGARYRGPADLVSKTAYSPNSTIARQDPEKISPSQSLPTGELKDGRSLSEVYAAILENYRTANSIVVRARRLEPTEPRFRENEPLDSAIERSIAEIWSELLGKTISERNVDFFAMGGDSLKAIRILSRLQRKFDVIVPLALFFEGPITINQLGNAVILALEEKEST
jgi:acyl carrier protein